MITLKPGQPLTVPAADLLGAKPAGPVTVAMAVEHAGTFAASAHQDKDGVWQVSFLGRHPGAGVLTVTSGDATKAVDVETTA